MKLKEKTKFHFYLLGGSIFWGILFSELITNFLYSNHTNQIVTLSDVIVSIAIFMGFSYFTYYYFGIGKKKSAFFIEKSWCFFFYPNLTFVGIGLVAFVSFLKR